MTIHVNVPPVTRLILILLIAFSFLHALGAYRKLPVPYLTLFPSLCLYYPWTLLTATFVERSILSLLVNVATFFFGGKYLERAWGSKEFGKVVLVASVIPNVVTVPVYFIWAYLSEFGRGPTQVSGGVALQAAFLVAFKQLVPEHTVAIFKGLVKTRVKHFPAVFLLVNSLSGLLLGTGTAAFVAWVALITAWTYLRFYKSQPDLSSTSTSTQTLKGDASETFTFAAFFPDKIQPAIAIVCDQIFIVLIHLRLCTPFSNEDVESGNQQAAARREVGLPSLLNNGGRTGRGTGKREEAERRRALALQALDQRLNAASTNRSTSQPVSIAPPVVGNHESYVHPDHTTEEAVKT